MPYNFAADSFHTTKLCSRLSSSEVRFYTIEIEQGVTSHQAHYRSYRGRFLHVIWPNQQCQSTKGSQLVLQIRLESNQDHSTTLQWYNSGQPPLCMA